MRVEADCTPQCQAFLAALQVLCDYHGVYLASSGDDALQVWRRVPGAPEAFDTARLTDCTDVEQDGLPGWGR
jgi:hypothetical protein